MRERERERGRGRGREKERERERERREREREREGERKGGRKGETREALLFLPCAAQYINISPPLSAGIPDFRSGMNTVLDTGPGVWEVRAQGTARSNTKITPILRASPTQTHMAIVKLHESGKS